MGDRAKFLSDVITGLFLFAGAVNLAIAFIGHWGSADRDWLLYSIQGWIFLVMVHLRLMEDK